MDLIEIRKHLHQHPELSGREHRTSSFIRKLIRQHTSFKPITVAKTGTLVHIKGKGEGPTTLFRGDIDALPIEENLDVPYNSWVAGISHKCGHDGHTVVMLGLLEKLSESPPENGDCLVLFQPAEETGQGAKAVLEDSVFSKYPFDYAYAFHNIPGEDIARVLVKEGSFSASVISCAIYIEGIVTHAAEPWKGKNPYSLVAQIYDYVKSLNNASQSSNSVEVITPIYASLGTKAYGNSAGKAELHFTIRAIDSKSINILVSQFQEFIHAAGNKEGLKIKEEWFETFHANENHPEAVLHVREAAKESNMSIKELTQPYRWGEDFGLLNKQAKGCMFGLGAGADTASLHDVNYDFPDDLIGPAVDIFFKIKQRIHDHD